MRVLITGAAGMIGRKLTERLLSTTSLGHRSLSRLTLLDVVPAPLRLGAERTEARAQAEVEVEVMTGDLADPTLVASLMAGRPELVFHLAGVVSGEAEANRAKGYRVNLDAGRLLLDALAQADGVPRVVFTSSIAVFGAPFPPLIDDDFHLTPLTSYGAQKAMVELLVADHTRRGLIDGRGIRLPTITVRPGRPNAAASGFYSSIIREPLAGQRAVLPVPRTTRHVHASPRSAVGFLLHAAELAPGALGSRPNLTMPSVSVTVGEQLEALTRVAGAEVAALVDDRPDPAVQAIVGGWPERFETQRADALGFRCESTYDEIIRSYLDHDAPTVDNA